MVRLVQEQCGCAYAEIKTRRETRRELSTPCAAHIRTACIVDGCNNPPATRGGECADHVPPSPFALNPFAEA